LAIRFSQRPQGVLKVAPRLGDRELALSLQPATIDNNVLKVAAGAAPKYRDGLL
jgi:hypothetical protein